MSCLVSNCKSCKDLACIECDFGYKLSGSTCTKKCVSSLCTTCNDDPTKCDGCVAPYTLNPTTKACVWNVNSFIVFRNNFCLSKILMKVLDQHILFLFFCNEFYKYNSEISI